MPVQANALYEAVDRDLTRAGYPAGPHDVRDVRQFASQALRKSLLKKFSSDSKPSVAQTTVAREKFLAANSKCSLWEYSPVTSGDEVLLGEFRSSMYSFFTKDGFDLFDSPACFIEYGKTGPGASLGALGNDFYTKLFASPLTSTSESLYVLYSHYIKKWAPWLDAEISRTMTFGGPQVVKASRLAFVPKNDVEARTICVEPNLNMFFQLGAGHILNRRLNELWGINIPVQQNKNRRLARKGSLYGDFVTFDLSSASDSVSRGMLKWCLPPVVFRVLDALRTPNVEVEGSYVSLDMMSSMGNGYTFSLETVVFSAVVLAAYRSLGIQPLYPRGTEDGNFAVYGDDIIVVKEASNRVYRLLELLGFTINRDKSFVEGPFRESCGGDYLNGRDVRGVYIKSLKTLQDHFVALNLLVAWSGKTGVFLESACALIRRHVPWLPVPPWDQDDAGIKMPEYLANPRCSEKLHGSYVFERYEPVTRKIRVEESALIVPASRRRSLHFNPPGLYVAFLQHSLVRMGIGVRQRTTLYRKAKAIAPSWGWPVNRESGFLEQRWETAAYFCLTSKK